MEHTIRRDALLLDLRFGLRSLLEANRRSEIYLYVRAQANPK